jgi:hypothetical protein
MLRRHAGIDGTLMLIPPHTTGAILSGAQGWSGAAIGAFWATATSAREVRVGGGFTVIEPRRAGAHPAGGAASPWSARRSLRVVWCRALQGDVAAAMDPPFKNAIRVLWHRHAHGTDGRRLRHLPPAPDIHRLDRLGATVIFRVCDWARQASAVLYKATNLPQARSASTMS